MIETDIRFHTLAIAKLGIICIQADNLDAHGFAYNLQKNNIFTRFIIISCIPIKWLNSLQKRLPDVLIVETFVLFLA